MGEEFDLDQVDRLLGTTRAVRRRLDLTRPVPAGVIEECLRLAIQAPTGSNAQGWRWLVVTDQDKRTEIARLYRRSFEAYLQLRTDTTRREAEGGAGEPAEDRRLRQLERVVASSVHLAEHLHEVPVHVIPCVLGRLPADRPAATAEAAGLFGSILPAVWSFQLALRTRGLGSVLTTLHLVYEREVAELLGIPDHVSQAALIPVAYYTGTGFRPAERRPVAEITYWDGWKNTR